MLGPCLRFRGGTFALLSIIGIGCGGGGDVPAGPGIGPPATLVVLAGNGQTGTVGKLLADEIAVRVTDATGQRVPGVSVVFDSPNTDGSFVPARASTDAQGEARAAWTLGATPGPVIARATVEGLAPEALSATAIAGPASQLVAVTGSGQVGDAGGAVAVAPVVEVLDAGGNAVAGVVVAFESTGGGSVTPSSVVTGPDGRAAPEKWTLDSAAGPNTLRASSTSVLGKVEFQATGVPGAVSSLRSTMSSTGGQLAGQTRSIRVEARDTFGNPIPGVAVRLDASGTGHTLTQPGQDTDATGIATGSILFTSVGSTTLSATLGNVPLEQTITLTTSYGEGTLTGFTYCTIAGIASVMDVYVPSASHPRPLPVMVQVHGGGYTGGNRSSGFWFPKVAQALLARGYLVVSVDYRLAPAHKYPAQIEDLKCAIRHLRANAARYGLDPNRIGAWGSSAGGQLVGLLGTSTGFDDGGGFQGESSAVQAVVALSPITDFTRTAELNDDYSREFPTWPDSESPELMEASPVTHITPGDSPFFFIAGDEDDLVLPAQSERMSRLLRDAGIASDVLVVAHADHDLMPTSEPIDPDAATIVARIANFFDRHLR